MESKLTWSEEYERGSLNRFAMISYLLISGAIFLIEVLELLNKERGMGSFLLAWMLHFLPLAGSWFLYTKKDKSYPYIMDLLGGGFAVFYTVELLTHDNAIAFLYVIPLLIIVMCYSNLRFSALCSTGVLIVNIIDETMNYFRGKYTADRMPAVYIKLIFITFCTIFIVQSARIMIKMNQMKLEMITMEKEASEHRSVAIMNISEKMAIETQQVLDVIEQLGNVVNSTKVSVNQVYEDTNETVNSVTVQQEMTRDIQNQILELNQVAIHLNENMKLTLEELTEGQSSISKLIHHAKATKTASNKVSGEMNNLNSQMENLQSIVDIINTITEQTSLLALNASIEAARAGEAGKGFAVVAQEISGLAVQTQDATVNITSQIQNIAVELYKVVEVVNQMIDMSEVQNDVAAKTADSINGIVGKIDTVNQYSNNLSRVVKLIESSNQSILESTETISEITKKVYDNMVVTLDVSEESSHVVEQVIGYVDSLSSSAKQLKELD